MSPTVLAVWYVAPAESLENFGVAIHDADVPISFRTVFALPMGHFYASPHNAVPREVPVLVGDCLSWVKMQWFRRNGSKQRPSSRDAVAQPGASHGQGTQLFVAGRYV